MNHRGQRPPLDTPAVRRFCHNFGRSGVDLFKCTQCCEPDMEYKERQAREKEMAAIRERERQERERLAREQQEEEGKERGEKRS